MRNPSWLEGYSGFLKLNIKELNFGKKIRGKKSKKSAGVIPVTITKRDCISIASEIFDLTGLAAPITGRIKLDISVLHQRQIGWDDPIPNELKTIWIANFDLIKELGSLTFRRAVIPDDAVNLDAETLDAADAGETLICSAIYIRYMRRCGKYSCQLIFALTKVIHDLTIPRAELAAALLNASTGHVVRLSLKDMHKKSWKLTDSQVTLHWLNCTKSALKMWVRNRVVEITWLCDRLMWHYVASKDMIADLGAKIKDVGPESAWIQGYPWMRSVATEFPIQSIDEIVLSGKDKNDANKEKVVTDFTFNNLQCLTTKYVPNEVGARYKFSNYLVDPNKVFIIIIIQTYKGLIYIQKSRIFKK